MDIYKYNTVGGYYDFNDTSYIYINQNIENQSLKEEIIAHENFHRTLNLSTIYGKIVGYVNIKLKDPSSNFSSNERSKLNSLYQELFNEMYLVQECGALARAYTMLPFIHKVRNAEQLLLCRRNYFSNLTPEYKDMANYYIGFLENLFNFEYIPSIIINYFNEAFTRYFLNNSYLKKFNSLEDLINLEKFEYSPSVNFKDTIDSIKSGNYTDLREIIVSNLKSRFYLNILDGMGEQFIEHMLMTGKDTFEDILIDHLYDSINIYKPSLNSYDALNEHFKWLKIFSKDGYKIYIVHDEITKRNLRELIKEFKNE